MATFSWRRSTSSRMRSTRSWSPALAASVAAMSWLVMPESAETTTIGRRCCRLATMPTALATRSASPTEVPPNLMTITDASPALRMQNAECKMQNGCASNSAFCILHSAFRPSQQSPRLQQLRVEQRSAGGSTNRVVDERDHADVKKGARADAADADGHAAFAVAVEARLRTVGLVEDVDRLFWRAWEVELLRDAFEAAQRLFDLVERRHVVAHGEGDHHEVAVDRRHTVGLRGDAHRRVDEA